MNSEIETIFKDFTVDDLAIPISFVKYVGEKETYLTYQSLYDRAALASDDKITNSINTLDIDVYSKSNYFKIIAEIKNIMQANDYMWIEDGPDLFEDETSLFHKTITFAKERSA